MERNLTAQRVRAFRKLKGFTQAEFAERSGISISVLGSVERGTRKPDMKILQRICSALDIDIEELQPPKLRQVERG